MSYNTKIICEKGVIVYGSDGLNDILKKLDGGFIIRFYKDDPHTIKEYRAYYFALRDIVYDVGETGYTKKEIHDLVKAEVLPRVKPSGFTYKELSTKYLNIEGWKEFIELFKEWSFESFNCYL